MLDKRSIERKCSQDHCIGRPNNGPIIIESVPRVPNTSLGVRLKNLEACQVSGLWNPGVGRLPFGLYSSCFVVLGRYRHLPAGISLRYHSTKCITRGGKCGMDPWSSFVL